MRNLSTQFSQIERVFVGCSHQKVWDHFTKAQRKNILAWRKQLTDVLSLAANRREDEDMELSEDEDRAREGEEPRRKKKKFNSEKLREESEEWACQAQVWRNEVEGVKAEMRSDIEGK